MTLHLWLDFSANPAQGWIQGGTKISHRGPFFKKLLQTGWLHRMHSNDVEECGKKCCYFWFHSEVKFFDVFLDLVILVYFNAISSLTSQFNLTYRYIDDVLSINNPDFENYLGQMYPAELEIKDTTESNTSASYLDLLLSIESDGQLRTSLYDKRDDFNFHITNFPFLSSKYFIFASLWCFYLTAHTVCQDLLLL